MRQGLQCKKNRRGIAWLVVLAMLCTLLPFNVASVQAESVEYVIQENSGVQNATISGTKLNVKINVPSQYSTTAKIKEAGFSKLEITYRVTNYTRSSESEFPGALIFFEHGGGWENQWQNIELNQNLTAELELSSYLSSDSTISSMGLQFENVTGDFSYEIISAKFVGTKSSGGDSGESGEGSYTSEANFAKLLQYSLYFYDANMCGDEVSEKSLVATGKKYGSYDGYRGDCHVCDKTASYNGKQVDVSGGYHDAGDHVKFNLPQAYTATTLGLAYTEFGEAFSETGQLSHYKTIMEHFCDYFVRCTILDGSGNVEAYCYQVGDGNTDHSVWLAPENQADRSSEAYFTSSGTPCTDIVCQTAVALAVHAYNFPSDAKSSEYLACAKKLFAYAESNQKATCAGSAVGSFYSGTSWEDDIALAAYWLHKATGDTNYQTKMTNYVSGLYVGYVNCWDDVKAAAVAYGKGWSDIKSDIDKYISTNSLSDGYTYISTWGSARYNTALQFEALCYDKNMGTSTYTDWAKQQMNYILGENSMNQCFVVGYNENSSKYPHHRAASGFTSNSEVDNGSFSNQKVLLGALCGGISDGSAEHNNLREPSCTKTHSDGTHFYHDDIKCYICNEVALDYNATLVASAAGLYTLCKSDGKQMLDTNYGIDSTATCLGNAGGIAESAGTTPTPASSATPSTTATPGASATPSTSASPSESATPSTSASPSESATPSASASPSESATPSTSASPSESATPAASASPGVSTNPGTTATPGEGTTPGTNSESGNTQGTTTNSGSGAEANTTGLPGGTGSIPVDLTQGGTVKLPKAKLSKKKLTIKRKKKAKITLSNVAKKTKVKVKYPKKKLRVKLMKNTANKKQYRIIGKKKGKCTVTFTIGKTKLKLNVTIK